MTKRYRFKFTGGFGAVLTIWVFSITVFLIPVAIIMLIDSIEIQEYEVEDAYE